MKTLNTFVCLIVATMMTFGVSSAFAGEPANRNYSPHCATKGEFRSVDTGDSRHLVGRVFDVPGVIVEQHGGAHVRSYKACANARAERWGIVYRKQGTDVWHLTDKYRQL